MAPQTATLWLLPSLAQEQGARLEMNANMTSAQATIFTNPPENAFSQFRMEVPYPADAWPCTSARHSNVRP